MVRWVKSVTRTDNKLTLRDFLTNKHEKSAVIRIGQGGLQASALKSGD